MFNDIPKLLLVGLTLLGPCSALADVIHWEALSEENTPAYWGEGVNFLLNGGFDFNSTTGTFSNITVKTSTSTPNVCLACNDFSDGGTATAFSFESYGGVEFSESYGPNAFSPGSNYWMRISGPGFDLSTPGTYANMHISYWGQILLYDPLDPDMYESLGCPECVSLTGTLVPIPEPETYALMLAGLGMLGWRAKRKAGINT